MKVLELFAGSRSIGKVCDDLGFEVFSCDINAFDKIDYVENILNFDYTKVPFQPDIIWASPPCTTFSVASMCHHWTKDEVNGFIPKTENAKIGVEIAKKTLEIIDHYKPKYYFIENPRGILRKMDFMQGLNRETVTYCQYDEDRMKPTDIWTNNLTWEPKTMCKNGDPCHVSAPRGARTGTQGMKSAYLRSIIPKELCKEIINSCIN